MEWLKKMLSSNDSVSCTRVCVVTVLGIVLVNYTFANIVMVVRGTGVASMSISEVIALIGMLAIKVGQKKLEK